MLRKKLKDIVKLSVDIQDRQSVKQQEAIKRMIKNNKAISSASKFLPGKKV